MRRWVRARPMLVIGVLAVVATSIAAEPASALPDTGAGVVAPAHASTSRPRSSTPSRSTRPTPLLQLAAVGDRANVDAPRVSVALDPGSSSSRTFVVTNHSSDLRLTVEFSAVDASTSASGAVKYASSASSDGPASWVTLSDLMATIEPGASERVSLTVEPPANALPGSVIAGVVASIDHAARADDGSAVAVHASVSLPVAIKINGAPTALVSISDVSAVKDHGKVYLDITFENAGGTANTMVGQVDVTGGRTYSVRTPVAPLKQTQVRVPFAMPNGAKTASVSVATQDAAGDQADWSGSVGFETPTASPAAPGQQPSGGRPATVSPSGARSLPRPALALTVLVFAAAAIWFAAELRRNRSRRRSLPPVPTTAAAYAAYAPVVADPLVAVVSQLGALVEAVDRLVTGIGGAPAPAEVATSTSTSDAAAPTAPTAPTPPPVPTPTATAPAATPAPAPAPPAAPAAPPKSAATELAELAALISMPASPSVPEFDESDPYDWPTQAQLDDFAERRRQSRNKPE